MPSKLSDIATPRKKYFDIVYKEVKKLKSGYGISLSEMAEKCGINVRKFERLNFPFLSEHNGERYISR